MKLLSSTHISNMELKNRIVMLPMQLGYCKGGYVSDQIVEFYRERAKGGAALIIVGNCPIDGHGYMDSLSLSKDAYIPGHQKLTQAVKESGSKIAAQLFHPGRYSSSAVTGLQSLAPSSLASGLTREEPKELSVGDIKQVIDRFGQAAVRVKKAGYDAVEIIGSAGYLISEFLSPLTNKRTDEYGGSFANRMRFCLEVFHEVREKVGSMPIIFRISGNDFMVNGIPNEEVIDLVKELGKLGVDAFNVTGGWHESPVPQITMDVPNGAYVYLAQSIRKATNLPVIACNRINNPFDGEEILQNGGVDMIGMARGLLADPYLPVKTAQNRMDEIRRCIGCNQGCLDNVFRNRETECLVNARAGKELEYSLENTEKIKKVLVIGGGVSGMEAAIVAAQRGHEVTLWEKSDELGGQALLAGATPGRQDFLNLVEDSECNLYAAGVHVEFNMEATVEKILSFKPDAVIVATGAEPIIPSIPGIEKPHVTAAWNILNKKYIPGQKIVVIGGGAVGLETASYLAAMGTIDAETVKFLLLNKAETPERIVELATKGTKDVVVIEMEKSIGRDIGPSTKWILLDKIKKAHVDVRTLTTVKSIEDDGVIIESKDGKVEKIGCDTVAVAIGAKSENQLFKDLEQKIPEVYLIGDASKPRKAIDGIKDGFVLGHQI
ncbi:MAG: NAD(P)/FAD-dependent oxidoreductase [Peptostreptococcales bacterium]|jgi:2,4-dienoyl-CoA reductase (NADPH2)